MSTTKVVPYLDFHFGELVLDRLANTELEGLLGADRAAFLHAIFIVAQCIEFECRQTAACAPSICEFTPTSCEDAHQVAVMVTAEVITDLDGGNNRRLVRQ